MDTSDIDELPPADGSVGFNGWPSARATVPLNPKSPVRSSKQSLRFILLLSKHPRAPTTVHIGADPDDRLGSKTASPDVGWRGCFTPKSCRVDHWPWRQLRAVSDQIALRKRGIPRWRPDRCAAVIDATGQVRTFNLSLLDLDARFLHDLAPARYLGVQRHAEFLWSAAARIDAKFD
jgi:hypothetical protein